MATRIEKVYRTNSLKLINDILNLINDYAQSTPTINRKEGDLIKAIVRTIDYFFTVNDITDEDIRRAVDNGKSRH